MPPEAEPKLPTLPHDLAAPESFLPGTPWWHYALMGLVILIIIALLTTFVIRQLRRSKLPALPPEDHLAKAGEILGEIDTQRPTGDVATECSLIVRECLHKIYREPVLFETDEEIKLRPDSLAKVPEPLRADLIQLLEKLGEEKYAPSQVSESKSASWIQQCQETLAQLKKTLALPETTPNSH